MNLECMSEMCCMWLTGNAGPKKSPKNCHLGTIAQLRRAISSQLRHVSTIGKKLVKQQHPPLGLECSLDGAIGIHCNNHRSCSSKTDERQ